MPSHHLSKTEVAPPYRALLSRAAWTKALLRAFQDGAAMGISPAAIDPTHRAPLLKHRDPEIARRAQALFGQAAGSRARVLALHEKFNELGLESPFDERWFERPSQDHLITTRIAVEDHYDARRLGLLAHATQIDPASPFWFGLPPEVARFVAASPPALSHESGTPAPTTKVLSDSRS